jgi:group I intron endonuclease
VNLINGKLYVGSAHQGKIGNRLHRHLFAGSGNKPVRNSVLKNGLCHFGWIVAEAYHLDLLRNAALLQLENEYIQKLKPEYNVAPSAGNTRGVKHTDETKAKMREKYSDERREKSVD